MKCLAEFIGTTKKWHCHYC